MRGSFARKGRDMNMSEAKKRILVIGDDEYLIKMLTYLFMSRGVEVEGADCGISAFERLKIWRPDLITVDLMMPGMNGFEFCEKVKSDGEFKDIPVIAISVMAEYPNRENLLELGACDYVQKPFKTSVLIEKIENILKLNP